MYNVVLVGIKKNESKLMTSLLVYSVRTGSIILLNGVSERGKVEGDVCTHTYYFGRPKDIRKTSLLGPTNWG